MLQTRRTHEITCSSSPAVRNPPQTEATAEAAATLPNTDECCSSRWYRIQQRWVFFGLNLRLQMFSFSNCNIKPNPTHLPKHQTLSPNHPFSQRI